MRNEISIRENLDSMQTRLGSSPSVVKHPTHFTDTIIQATNLAASRLSEILR